MKGFVKIKELEKAVLRIYNEDGEIVNTSLYNLFLTTQLLSHKCQTQKIGDLCIELAYCR